MTSDKARTERIQRVYDSRDYDELTTEYDGWATDYDADLESLGFIGPRTAAETLAKYVSDPEAKLLDAGAGTGMVGQELARLGFKRITALDLSPGMLMTANEKFVYEELVVGELGKPLSFDTEGLGCGELAKPLPFETDAFDSTTCVGTFTFGHAPAESLDELVRVTKPGGYIVFSIRTDYYTEGGFNVKQNALAEAGKWEVVEQTDPFQPMPNGEPDIWYYVWAYRVL